MNGAPIYCVLRADEMGQMAVRHEGKKLFERGSGTGASAGLYSGASPDQSATARGRAEDARLNRDAQTDVQGWLSISSLYATAHHGQLHGTEFAQGRRHGRNAGVSEALADVEQKRVEARSSEERREKEREREDLIALKSKIDDKTRYSGRRVESASISSTST
ncbi:hypothetical protein NliqN6_4542 [Naganishia liquefaciens]|uniref:Uncharacterized protein n=1 Tax=Naganishia liquefaciens TaxID=104408 RepID=A0A8H3TWM5_9TREE|nr:hypothetical protein NliqN6_4542 [Naganishia liquefaciens]